MNAFKTTGRIIALVAAACLLTFSAAMAQEVLVEGTVLPTRDGYELLAGNGQTYTLEGQEKALSKLVPRRVQITGDLAESASGKTIQIHTVEDASY